MEISSETRVRIGIAVISLIIGAIGGSLCVPSKTVTQSVEKKVETVVTVNVVTTVTVEKEIIRWKTQNLSQIQK